MLVQYYKILFLNSKIYFILISLYHTYNNLIKITFATFVMTILLIFLLNFLSENFVYNSYIKILYLLLVIFLAAATYFIICYLLGILKITKQSLSRVLNQLVKDKYILVSTGEDKRTKKWQTILDKMNEKSAWPIYNIKIMYIFIKFVHRKSKNFQNF